MKAVVIEQETFDREFKITLDTLKLDRFVQGGGAVREEGRHENSPIGAMHRTFVYEVCQLRNRLEKS